MFCDKSKPRQGKLHDTHTHYHTVNMNTNYPHALSSPSITPSHPSSPCHTRDSWLIRHYCHAPYHRRHTGLNYWPLFNKAMDCLRNGAGTAVDYIESLLFYILRMSDFCYLHPSTPARQRLLLIFARDEWEWPRGIKNKKTKRGRRRVGLSGGVKGRKKKVGVIKAAGFWHRSKGTVCPNM